MGLVMIIYVTGCTAKGNVNLEDYYGELINKPFKEISMAEVKKSLKGFEYEYELHEYSKEDISEYEGYMELNDSSDNKFKDGNGNFIDVTFDETNKEVSGLEYSKEEKDIKTKIVCGESFSMAILYGSNIEKQKNIIDNFKLYKSLNQIVKSYFKAVSNLRDEKEMTVDDVKSILKMDYEKMEDEYNSEDTSRYLFAPDFGEDAYIDVETKGTKVKDIDLKIYLGENANYTVSLSATNENQIDKNESFRLDTNISPSLGEDLVDELGNLKEGALTKSNVELFNFIFKGGDINFYAPSYNEESENETSLLGVKLNKNEDENVIDFRNKRVVIEDDRPYDVDKTFKVKLKKDELLKINMEMKTGKKLSVPIVITLQDLSNGEYIYSKSVDNTDENIFTTEKVDKDGEYEISVLMSDLEKYKFEISLVKE